MDTIGSFSSTLGALHLGNLIPWTAVVVSLLSLDARLKVRRPQAPNGRDISTSGAEVIWRGLDKTGRASLRPADAEARNQYFTSVALLGPAASYRLLFR